MSKLQLCFHVNAVCLPCKTWNATKPGAWSARPPPGAQQSQDFSLILSLVLQKVLHSQRVVTPSHSRSGRCPGKLEARSEACSALSLKPKQHCSFNFPNIHPEVKLLDRVTIQYLIFLRSYHTFFIVAASLLHTAASLVVLAFIHCRCTGDTDKVFCGLFYFFKIEVQFPYNCIQSA